MHPPFRFLRPFSDFRSLWIIFRRLFFVSHRSASDGKDTKMKLKIRYDEQYQIVELDETATKQMYVMLGIEEDEDATQEENEQRIQDAFEVQYNRPEYNSWHKFDRHRGFSKAKPGKDGDDEDVDPNDPLPDEVADDRIFHRDEIERDKRESREAVCDWVKKVLCKKPEWADMFIAVRIDGENIRDYAARTGVDENNVTQKLKRAEKKLRENYKNRQI